jgi:hypothetical protein
MRGRFVMSPMTALRQRNVAEFITPQHCYPVSSVRWIGSDRLSVDHNRVENMSGQSSLPWKFFVSGSLAILAAVGCTRTQSRAAVSTAAEVGRIEPREPALRDELLAMMAKDQELRTALGESNFTDKAIMEELNAVDHANTARMKDIVAAHGFPGRRLVGEDGARAAWLLVQHADREVAFQRECLDQMESLADRGEVSQADLAYLTDRVLVNEGKPQRYGTQFHTVDGKLQPRPLEDPERVDELRKTVGLSTMKEYEELMTLKYGG